jgi:hypothetical protein
MEDAPDSSLAAGYPGIDPSLFEGAAPGVVSATRDVEMQPPNAGEDAATGEQEREEHDEDMEDLFGNDADLEDKADG